MLDPTRKDTSGVCLVELLQEEILLRVPTIFPKKAPCIRAAEPAEKAERPQQVASAQESQLDWLSRACLVLRSTDAMMSIYGTSQV